jgi:hypothetical protein
MCTHNVAVLKSCHLCCIEIESPAFWITDVTHLHTQEQERLQGEECCPAIILRIAAKCAVAFGFHPMGFAVIRRSFVFASRLLLTLSLVCSLLLLTRQPACRSLLKASWATAITLNARPSRASRWRSMRRWELCVSHSALAQLSSTEPHLRWRIS